MPSALPACAASKATQLLQQNQRMILTVPEVHGYFGKAGRAETATDQHRWEMFEDQRCSSKPRDHGRADDTRKADSRNGSAR